MAPGDRGTGQYRRLFSYLTRYTALIALTLLASILFVGLNSLSIWMVASLINTILVSPENVPLAAVDLSAAANIHELLKGWTANLIQRPTPLQTLGRLCWWLLAIFLAKNVMFYIKNMLAGVVENRLIRNLRNDLFSHIHSLSLSYFDRHHTAVLSSIVLNDVTSVQGALSIGIRKLIVEPINLLVFIAVLFIISWQLALLAVLVIPVAVIVVTRLGKSLRRRSRRTAQQIAGVMRVLQETLLGVRMVKAFVMEAKERRRFRNENQAFYRLVFRRMSLRNTITPVNDMIGVFIGVAILWVGGQQVLLGPERGVGPEEFMSFIIFMFAMLQPLRNLGNVSANIQVGMASAERIFNLLDVPVEITDKADAVTLAGFEDTIRFENVTFQYEASGRPAIHDIKVQIARGQIVALVGVSGSGKSTFVDLIPRFYDVTSGAVIIDGHDVRDVKISSLRRLIGAVPQETRLFDDTIRNNILYGDPDADEARLTAAARAAHAWEFIEGLPQGLDTLIGEQGVKLSGGQRQRLAIARALLKNPPILILDEATSALDTEAERQVQKAIDELVQNRTVIVIAHRLSTIQNADLICVLDEGRLVETGTHTELLARDGRYRKLYYLQFAEGNETQASGVVP